jgi:hypothetical protein
MLEDFLTDGFLLLLYYFISFVLRGREARVKA